MLALVSDWVPSHLINEVEQKRIVVRRWLRWPWYQYRDFLPIKVKLKTSIFNDFNNSILFLLVSMRYQDQGINIILSVISIMLCGLICPPLVSVCLFRTFSGSLIDTFKRRYDTQQFSHRWSLNLPPDCGHDAWAVRGQVHLMCHQSHEHGVLSTAHQSGLRIKAIISSISHITRWGNREEFPGRRI